MLSAASALSSTIRTRELPCAWSRTLVVLFFHRIAQNRKRNFELAAVAEAVTVRLHSSAMHRDELLHQRQPDAEAALRAIHRDIALREQVEHAREHLGRDSDAGIAHADGNISALAAHRDLDASARRRELARILDEVADDLLHSRRIHIDANRSGIGRRDHDEALLARFSGRAGFLDGSFDDAQLRLPALCAARCDPG